MGGILPQLKQTKENDSEIVDQYKRCQVTYKL